MYYYILIDPEKKHLCKLGISKSPKQRIKAYRTAAPDCYFEKIYVLPHKIHEKKILEIIKERFTVKSEVVYAHPKLVQNIIEGYFIDNSIEFS